MNLKKRFLVQQLTILSLLATILMCSSSWAATYYVDPNGNDTAGNGSQTSPWKSLSTACSKVGSGNTIYLNAGSYTDNKSCSLAMGVTIAGAGKGSVTITSAYSGGYGTAYIYRGGDNVSTNPLPHANNDISGFTLNGSNKTLSCGIWLRGSDYITIHDMAFKNIKTTAINLGGWNAWADYNTSTSNPPACWGYNDTIHDVTIDNCTTKNTQSTDDRLGAIDLKSLANCQIYNVTINENYADSGTGIKAVVGWLKGFKLYNSTITMFPTNTDSFVMETYNFSGDSEVYNNTFNHFISLNGGVKTLDSGSTWNLKIHDNVFNMTALPSTMSGNEFSHNWLNAYNNYFYGGNHPAVGLWSTNYLTSSGVAHWRMNNNVFFNCSEGIYVPRGANSYVEILNNTFDSMTGNPWGGKAVDITGGSISSLKIQNNLITNSGGTIGTGGSISGSTVDHNWLNTANPGITGSGNRPSPYYRPSSTSSNLADAGTNVGLPFTGSAPAIGAFEPGVSLNAPSNLTVK
jgi:hypothetical protein